MGVNFRQKRNTAEGYARCCSVPLEPGPPVPEAYNFTRNGGGLMAIK